MLRHQPTNCERMLGECWVNGDTLGRMVEEKRPTPKGPLVIADGRREGGGVDENGRSTGVNPPYFSLSKFSMCSFHSPLANSHCAACCWPRPLRPRPPFLHSFILLLCLFLRQLPPFGAHSLGHSHFIHWPAALLAPNPLQCSLLLMHFWGHIDRLENWEEWMGWVDFAGNLAGPMMGLPISLIPS